MHRTRLGVEDDTLLQLHFHADLKLLKTLF